MKEEITNGHLALRRYRPEFIPLLFEAACESKGGEFTRWMPWCHESYSISDSEEFVKSMQSSWENGTDFGFAIFESDAVNIVGGVGLNQFNTMHNFANLGYWVKPSKQGHGIASTAVRMLAAAAFEALTTNRIEILAAIENAASRRAAEKAGANFEGVSRNRLLIGGRVHDAALFSLVRSDLE